MSFSETTCRITSYNVCYTKLLRGGRYSIWSAVSLCAAAVMGESGFSEFLQGAAAMDRHFREAPLKQNLPVLLSLVGIRNNFV